VISDDFERDVYCLFGLPFDAVDMAQALAYVRSAADRRSARFLSTPNLNFLIASQSDAAFRDSVVNSDLSVADGMPLVWMARLLRIPIRERVAGSGLFEGLMNGSAAYARPISVYFFGGPPGVAESACRKLNETKRGLCCVGALSPGFGTVEEMSGDDVIAGINASGADFLVVSLGARKGQAWIERNRSRLSVPVVSHLGAVVNFVAGTLRRAPVWMQRAGAEWLWRIKEEPLLWQRYWRDAVGLGALVFWKLLPQLFSSRLDPAARKGGGYARIEVGKDIFRLMLVGAIPDPLSPELRTLFRSVAQARQDVVVDCSEASFLGPGLLGLLLMLRKHQHAHSKSLRVTGASSRLRRRFRWNGVEYLIDTHSSSPDRGGNGTVIIRG
jgi:N-acetylglucosaminyldiphosphoundecaprenol N-acetyl-beta-D-mannosaminyltransferase